ncbi:MAG: Nramp family divalent metal transporter [Solirubrobacterales bacterium]|nr:Nramp family divalent metal transporter [Solirubrobacterales bacterium]OJU94703.1 MAG: divalent metal cation transporter [Solirubrobacterales bacterium 67-14]
MPSPTQLEQLRSKGRLRYFLSLFGAAFVAAVAYVDPGNFATNVAAGAEYGYMLLWTVLAANLMAMLIQFLSAKMGIATGRNLAELCRENFSRPVTWGLWVQAEIIAMATDLAEIVGAAIALNLLFGTPLFVGGLIGSAVAFVVLALRNRGYRRFETAIIGLLGIILAGFLYEAFKIGPDASGVVEGFVPHLAGTDSLLLAVGIIGATVMPHVIYLHSALTQDRIHPHNDEERHSLINFQKIDVGLAMGIAGFINMSMLAIAAAVMGGTGIDTIEGAYQGLKDLVSPTAALAFGLALLASGIAASSVGTFAGQVVMQGFINRTIPLFLRRAITMAPALIILAIGLDPTRSLVISQVVLSFGIPFALVPLIMLTARRDVMGKGFENHMLTTAFASVFAAIIIALNLFLLFQTFIGT